MTVAAHVAKGPAQWNAPGRRGVTVIVRPHRSAVRVQERVEDTCCSVSARGFATYDTSNGKTG